MSSGLISLLLSGIAYSRATKAERRADTSEKLASLEEKERALEAIYALRKRWISIQAMAEAHGFTETVFAAWPNVSTPLDSVVDPALDWLQTTERMVQSTIRRRNLPRSDSSSDATLAKR